MNEKLVDAWYAAQEAKFAENRTKPPRRQFQTAAVPQADNREAQFNQSLSDNAATLEIINLMLSISDDPDEASRTAKRATLQDLQNNLRREESTAATAVAPDADADTEVTPAALDAIANKITDQTTTPTPEIT